MSSIYKTKTTSRRQTKVDLDWLIYKARELLIENCSWSEFEEYELKNYNLRSYKDTKKLQTSLLKLILKKNLKDEYLKCLNN